MIYIMTITIQTIHGVYTVPPEKYDSLIMWLESNAIKLQQNLGEFKETTNINRRLIVE